MTPRLVQSGASVHALADDQQSRGGLARANRRRMDCIPSFTGVAQGSPESIIVRSELKGALNCCAPAGSLTA